MISRFGSATLAIALLAGLLISCVGPSPHPTDLPSAGSGKETASPDTPAAVPTPSDSLPPVIDAGNAARLVQIGHTSIGVEGVSALAWSPDGSTIAIAASNGLLLFDAYTLQQTGQLAVGEAIQSLAFSPDGLLLVTIPSEPNAPAQIWDIANGQEASLLMGRLNGVRSVAFSVERSMIATGSADGTVILWDWNTQQPIHTMNLNETVGDITGGQAIGVGWLRFSPDGTTLAGAGDLGSGILILWNTDDGSVQKTLTAMGHIAGPVATPLLAPEDWNYVYWWSRGSVIQVDTTTDQEGLRFSHEDFVVSASFSPDGLILATASAGTVNDTYTPLIKLWDVTSGQELATLTGFSSIPTALAFSPAGRWLAVASGEDGLMVWGAS